MFHGKNVSLPGGQVMGEVIDIAADDRVLECNNCGGQGFIVLCSSDGLRAIGFECLRCGVREYIGGN